MKTTQDISFRLSVWLVLAFMSCNVSFAQMRSSVSQREFTWIFDKDYECGQFVNGDWWVVGPVKIISVSPETRTAIPEELNDLGENTWGDTGLQNDPTVRNGSMVVMSLGSTQGYDSRGKSFNASAVIEFPYDMPTNRSLISSKSSDTIPRQFMFHEMMWSSEKYGKSVIQTASILTCLEEAPPEDAFRPAYVGAEKWIFTLSDVNYSQLRNLAPTSSIPSWESYERYFERPWLDHLNGSWLGQELLPSNMNQPAYGREYARLVSKATLMLNTAASNEQKEKLLIGVLQLGIDLRGIAELGGNWVEGGGHTSGRKWPILFAYKMFDDPYFNDMPNTAVFHEDTETYYGNGWAGQAALWQIVMHHGIRLPYMHKHASMWSSWDVQDGTAWGSVSESYRVCCNTQAWVGQTLAALLMEAKACWNHNAYFDNVEDWMRQEDLYAENRSSMYPRHSWEESASYFGYDDFVDEMWTAYRSQVPDQEGGALNNYWNPNGYWEDNEIINTLPPQEIMAGESKQLSISTVIASEVANLTISCNNLPSFCVLNDDGNGVATLTMEPGNEDVGDYSLHILASSGSFTQASDSISILVNENISSSIHVEEKATPRVRIYPNPIFTEMNIEINGIESGNVALLIYDFSGKMVYSDRVDVDCGASLNIDTEQFAEGLYFVVLKSDFGMLTEKIIHLKC